MENPKIPSQTIRFPLLITMGNPHMNLGFPKIFKSKKILVESDSDGLSNLIRTLVNLFFVEISRFEHSN